MRLRGCPRRRGATLVETAVVISCTLLLILGIFEYCRFVFVLQVAEGAAREGARFAVAHTGDGTTLAQVQNHIKNKMAGRDIDLVGYDAKVENVNPATGAIIPSSAWNDAPFGGAIRVRITGNYRPMLPSLLSMSSSIPFSTTSMMTSEAN